MKIVESPYVLGLKDACYTSARYYIFMEQCNGGDLRLLQDARIQVSEPEACLILDQILTGMSALKANNILHRDFKLENVLLHFPEE